MLSAFDELAAGTPKMIEDFLGIAFLLLPPIHSLMTTGIFSRRADNILATNLLAFPRGR